VKPGAQVDRGDRERRLVPQQQLPDRRIVRVGRHLYPARHHHRPDPVARHAYRLVQAGRQQPRHRRLARRLHARDHEQRHTAIMPPPAAAAGARRAKR
jgi:hypothetical protein